jgi:Ca-activated chloride channel homolog
MTPSRRLFLAFALGQITTFSSKLDVVRIDARVTDNGRVIQGLQPADFEVRDNGVLQQVDFVSFAELPLNVVLALDASSSVSGDRLRHLRGAGGALIDALQTDDRVALLTFSHAVSLREALTGDTARIRRALETLEPGGETSLVDAAYAAMKLAQPDGGSRNLIIVFSDGQDTSSWLTGARVIEVARSADAPMFGVTVRGTRGPEFLRDLAAATGGSLIEIESTRDLGATFTRVLGEFRQRYLIGFSPRGVAGRGFHTLQVRVKGRRAQVDARAGYLAGP